MSYATFIAKPTSEKNVIFELTKGTVIGNIFWIKEAPGVWKTTYSWTTGASAPAITYGITTWGAGNYGKASSTVLGTSANSNVSKVSSISVGTVLYTAVESKELVAETPDSFFWDETNQILYASYNGFIGSETITFGITVGYANKYLAFGNQSFESRVKSIPNMSVKRDNLFKSVVTFQGGTVVLENADGEFNNFRDEDVYGWPVTIRFGGDDLDFDDYETVYTGYLKSWDLVGNTISINVKDERENLQRRIPNTYFNQTDYTDLDDRDVGKAIPIGYGIIKRGTAICTNRAEAPAPATYNFKFVDTTNHNIESIDQVYVEGVAVAHTAGSTTGGTFNLATALYDPGNKVSVDFGGYVDGAVDLIDNPMDIIVDLTTLYADRPFTSVFYNTSEWTATSSGLPGINIFLDKPVKLIKVIGQLSQPILGTFIVQGDGLFNMKVVDLSGAVTKTIEYSEHMVKPKTRNLNKDYISSARVGYGQSYDTKEYASYTNTASEASLFTRFRSYKEQPINTTLTANASAVTYSASFMALFGGIFSEHTIVTKTQNIDVEIEDIINIETEQDIDGLTVTAACEVTGTAANFQNNRVTITAREVAKLTDLVFYDDDPVVTNTNEQITVRSI